MKHAVIDIGSNSVRLMTVADGKVLYKRLKTTRLGEGISFSARLSRQAIDRTANAVAEFYAQAISEGIFSVYAFATAAVRSAENGADFTGKVKALCGLSVEVISGEKEAEIGVLGALGTGRGGLIDVGGASTEVIVKNEQEILYKKSLNIGVVRLKDTCGRDLPKLTHVCAETVKEYGDIPLGYEMYAVGGTATTLAALYLDLPKYDGEKVTGTKLSLTDLEKAVERLANSSVEEIARHPCVDEKRADVLLGGAVVLLEIVKRYGFSGLTVSDRDNLEGYAITKGLL